MFCIPGVTRIDGRPLAKLGNNATQVVGFASGYDHSTRARGDKRSCRGEAKARCAADYNEHLMLRDAAIMSLGLSAISAA